ncbi:MAG: hypothetical protein SOY04_00175 [Clostridium celatum]|nr:hypothetical protein [Clostridium celatum]MDY4501159.1 hypothetical protein [Lactobacillus johnsonii]
MAKYTLELYKLIEQNLLWNFDYDFYSDDPLLKKEFEKMFNDYYYFDEIGFGAIAEFKHYLKRTLNLKMPYYKQLWNIEVLSKNKDFFLSKDLIESFTREVDSTNTNTTDTNSRGSAQNNSKVSNLDNGVSSAQLEQNFLTGVSQDDNSTNTTSNANSNGTGKILEKTTFESKGDIGIQTPAYAVEQWRKILININEMLIQECYDLFIRVY